MSAAQGGGWGPSGPSGMLERPRMGTTWRGCSTRTVPGPFLGQIWTCALRLASAGQDLEAVFKAVAAELGRIFTQALLDEYAITNDFTEELKSKLRCEARCAKHNILTSGETVG